MVKIPKRHDLNEKFAKNYFPMAMFIVLYNAVVEEILNVTEATDRAPVVQRPDNLIEWISHYPTVSIRAKISLFPRVQANMHTLTTAKFGSVRKPWTKFNVKYILDPE